VSFLIGWLFINHVIFGGGIPVAGQVILKIGNS
jgi:hypothetical protein